MPRAVLFVWAPPRTALARRRRGHHEQVDHRRTATDAPSVHRGAERLVESGRAGRVGHLCQRRQRGDRRSGPGFRRLPGTAQDDGCAEGPLDGPDAGHAGMLPACDGAGEGDVGQPAPRAGIGHAGPWQRRSGVWAGNVRAGTGSDNLRQGRDSQRDLRDIEPGRRRPDVRRPGGERPRGARPAGGERRRRPDRRHHGGGRDRSVLERSDRRCRRARLWRGGQQRRRRQRRVRACRPGRGGAHGPGVGRGLSPERQRDVQQPRPVRGPMRHARRLSSESGAEFRDQLLHRCLRRGRGGGPAPRHSGAVQLHRPRHARPAGTSDRTEPNRWMYRQRSSTRRSMPTSGRSRTASWIFRIHRRSQRGWSTAGPISIRAIRAS